MESSLRRDIPLALLLGCLLGAASLAASRPQAGWIALPLLLLALVWWVASKANRWVLVFLAALVLLPPLPLPFGNAGPHPAILLAALGLWAGAARLPAWRFRWNSVSAALLFFLFALTMSVPLAAVYSGWEVSLGSLARVGLFALSVYVFFYLAHGPGRNLAPERLVRLLFWSGLASAAFACLDFYFQFPAPARFAEQYVWLSSSVLRRAQGVFYEATALGSFCVFLLLLAASIVVVRPAGFRFRTIWLLLAALISGAALFLSFSRSAAASLLVALAALAWLERKRFRITLPWIRGGLAALTILLAGTLLLSRIFPEVLESYLGRLWSTASVLLEAPDLVLAPRLASWRFLWSAIADNPWHMILGIGYKTLPYSSFLGRPVVADNMYLSLLVETGWLGTAALLGLNTTILVASFRQAHEFGMRRLIGVWMFSFWCGQMVQMLFGDILTYWRLLPLYFSVLAVGARSDDDSLPRSI